MSIELDFDSVVYLTSDADACLFLNLTCCTVFRRFLFIPFAFGKAKLVFDLDDKQFGSVPIKDNSAAHRLILLYFENEQLRINF